MHISRLSPTVTFLIGKCLGSYYASASVIRKEEAITKNATSIIIIEIIIFGILIV